MLVVYIHRHVVKGHSVYDFVCVCVYLCVLLVVCTFCVRCIHVCCVCVHTGQCTGRRWRSWGRGCLTVSGERRWTTCSAADPSTWLTGSLTASTAQKVMVSIHLAILYTPCSQRIITHAGWMASHWSTMLCISVWTATHLELQFLVLFCIVHTNHLRNVLEITEVSLRTACTEFRGRVLWPVLFLEEQQMALLQTADQTAPQHLQHHAFYIADGKINFQLWLKLKNMRSHE